MVQHVRAAIIGGGAVGAGILYGLARRGWTDCVLIEKSRLASASTRLAGGLVPTYVRSDAASRLINKTISIFKGLEEDTGQAIGLHACGQMRIARSRALMDEYVSYMTTKDAIGANAELLTPEQAVALWPLIENTEGMQGALYHPDDVYVSPTDVTVAMAKGATQRGARVQEGTEARSYTQLPSGEWKIETSKGDIIAEHLVMASGTYARRNGAKLGLDLPCWPVIVQYWFTDTIPEVAERRRQGLPEMPLTRDEHWLGYTRQEGDAIMFGSYERPENLQLFDVETMPEGFEDDAMPSDFDSNSWGFERGMEVMPCLARAAIKANVRGPMQMTGDGMPLVGPAWGLRNVWLAEGMPGGVLWSATTGYYLSEWMIEGTTSIDMRELDPRRFGDHATGDWIRAKAVELWGKHSDVILPGEELPAARPVKVTPGYDRLTALGAVWGAQNGWEVANWYAPEGVAPVDQPGYRTTGAHRHSREEALAVRNAAGLIDNSAYAKFEISGPEAAAFLDRLFASPLPEPGSVGGAYQLFPTGGVRAGYTIARLDQDRFWLIAGPASERLSQDELRRHLPSAGVSLRNITMQNGIFAVTGPTAPAIMAALGVDTGVALRTSPLGLASEVTAMRTSPAGEQGWELHFPIAYQRHLLDRLLDVGARHGLRLVGQRALNPLRLEKSYRAVGPDMNVEITAVEAGLLPALNLDKDFIGRPAVLAQQAVGPSRRLVTLAVETDDASLLGHESVYREGRIAGRVTSGAFSPVFGHDIALALMPADLAEPGIELTVPVLDKLRPARIIPDSPYDPEGLRCL